MAGMLKTTDTAGRELHPPRHIAIIMDGNGRWATRRGLPRTAGHKAGAETFRRIATYCKDIGVEYLTVYAFSTENWKRSADEVGAIMGLLKRYLLEAVDTMEKDHIRLRFFGDMTPIAPELQALAHKTDSLPYIALDKPNKAISANTRDCMNAGVIFGHAGAIDGVLRRFERELGCKPTVIATGGRAKDIIPYCEADIILDKELILKGLYSIYRKNRR